MKYASIIDEANCDRILSEMQLKAENNLKKIKNKIKTNTITLFVTII